MVKQQIRLCDKCHKREATCFVRGAAVDSSGKAQIGSINVCQECFEAGEPPQRSQSRRAGETAHCEYCCRTPCVDWNSLANVLGVVVGLGETRFLCETCCDEYNRSLGQQLENIPHGLPDKEEVAKLRAVKELAHQHMLQWVAKPK